MQKILKIQCGANPITQSPTAPSESLSVSDRDNLKRSLVEDMKKKYTNIKIRKISAVPSNGQNLEDAVTPPKAAKLPKSPPAVPEDNRIDVQKSFMCISCSEKFHKFNDLESHLRTCKTNATQQFKCFCGKVLRSKVDLSVHVSVAHKQNKQQHICTTCKKIFSSLANLQNHVMMTHKSPQGNLKGSFMCHICDEKFTELPALLKHRKDSSCKPRKKQSES